VIYGIASVISAAYFGKGLMHNLTSLIWGEELDPKTEVFVHDVSKEYFFYVYPICLTSCERSLT